MRTISELAGLLDCSEWDVFEKAFVQEFGASSNDDIETSYNMYLETGIIPAWVASFIHEYPENLWEAAASCGL